MIALRLSAGGGGGGGMEQRAIAHGNCPQDFVETYFALHGLEPLKDFLRHWHMLVFVEGVIYQADEDNEQAAGGGGSSNGEDPTSSAGLLPPCLSLAGS